MRGFGICLAPARRAPPWPWADWALQVLPTVISFIDAKVVDRIVGFDELGSTDEFDVN